MGNDHVILLLITLMMMSGIIVPYAQAAGPLGVDFNATPQFGARPLNVQFNDATSSADPANNTYLWTFGDGNTSTEINPPHTYNTSGIFTVNLTVTEITGNNATLSKPFYIHISDTANATDFSGIPRCGLSPLPVQFIDGVTFAHDQWQWDFGDGGASNVSDPLHTYNGEGDWNVSLFVSNTSGGQQGLISTSGYIRVIPVAVTSFSATGTSDNTMLTVQFNDTSTGFVSPVTYAWNFGDNTTSPEKNPSHTYANSSMIYTVALTVSGYCGQTMTSFDNLTVSGGSVVLQPVSVPQAPVVDFTGTPLSGSAPLNVSFSDLSRNDPITWNWSFGDGTFALIRNPVHTYASPGNYTVSLTVANPRGSSTKALPEYITVSEFHSTDFTGSPTFGSLPLTVQFTDLSYGFKEPVTYFWNFGDGGSSSVRNASHTYATSGLYSVSLTIAGSDRYSETIVKPRYINTEPPMLELSVTPENTNQLLPSSTLVPSTQSTQPVNSLSMSRPDLPVQSLPMEQSLPSYILGSPDQSYPQDISPQNRVSAGEDRITIPQPSVNWSLKLGDNPFPNAFFMQVHSSVNWTVYVWDGSDKPGGNDGRMREYNFGSSTWGPMYLTNQLELQSISRNTSRHSPPVVLTGSPQPIEEGPSKTDPTDPFKYDINLMQRVDTADTGLSSGEVYHIVITFELSPNI